MKQKRRLGVLFGGFGIVLILILTRVLYSLSLSGDENRRAAVLAFEPQGEILNVSDLNSDQRIEINHLIDGDRSWSANTYIITGREPRNLLVMERSVEHQPSWGSVAVGYGRKESFDLSKIQQKGLDVFLGFLRMKIGPKRSSYETFEIDYFSGDRKIGSEKIFDFAHLLGRCETGSSYDSIDPGYRRFISMDDWDAMLAFGEGLNSVESKFRR